MPALTGWHLSFRPIGTTMSTSKATALAQLRQLQRARTLVRLERAALENGHVTGRIVACSAKLVAIAVVSDTIRPDGFNVFRRADITKLTAPDPFADFVAKALRLRGESLPRATLDLASWRSLVHGARRFPLITVHTEVTWPDSCFIGQPTELTSRTLTLRTIDPGAVWHPELNTYDWADVTRIDFGGGYEDALALVAGSN